MAATFFPNTPTIGVDLNNGNSTALFAVGAHILGNQGTEWVYVQANTSINGNTVVAFNSGTYTCGMASGGDLTLLGSQIATAQTSISSQAFGWVAIRGIGLTVQQTGTSSVQGSVYLAASGAPTGVLIVNTTTSNTVVGLSVVGTVSATYAVTNWTWPRGNAPGL